MASGRPADEVAVSVLLSGGSRNNERWGGGFNSQIFTTSK